MLVISSLALIAFSDTDTFSSDEGSNDLGFGILSDDPFADTDYFKITTPEELALVGKGVQDDKWNNDHSSNNWSLTARYYLANDIVFSGDLNDKDGVSTIGVDMSITINVTSAGNFTVDLAGPSGTENITGTAWVNMSRNSIPATFSGVDSGSTLIVGGTITVDGDTHGFAYSCAVDTSTVTASTRTFSSNGNFSPIGYDPSNGLVNYFGGTFNGNGHIITGMTVSVFSSDDHAYAGMFGIISGTGVSNIGLIDNNITSISQSHSAYAGSIAGNSPGSITNCYGNGSVSVASSSNSILYAGGIVGISYGSVLNCYSAGIVSASSIDSPVNAGGIAGLSAGTIAKCYNTGAVSVYAPSNQTYAGGIVGGSMGQITNCYNTGKISASSGSLQPHAGGIAGTAIEATISKCYNTGPVSASASSNATYAGGIIGDSLLGSITDCYNTGSVFSSTSTTIPQRAYAGGIAGYTSSLLANCYNIGTLSVSARNYVGGIAGNSAGAIVNCYYLNSSSVLATALSATDGTSVPIRSTVYDQTSKPPKSDTQMRPDLNDAASGNSIYYTGTTTVTAGTLAGTVVQGWKFGATWTIHASMNNGYPILDSFLTSVEITEDPVDQTVVVGESAVFTVSATVTPSGLLPQYQWYSSADGVTWSPISGANGSSYIIPATTDADNGTHYKVTVTAPGYGGTEESAEAMLNVTKEPHLIVATADPIGSATSNYNIPTEIPDGTVDLAVRIYPTTGWDLVDLYDSAVGTIDKSTLDYSAGVYIYTIASMTEDHTITVNMEIASGFVGVDVTVIGSGTVSWVCDPLSGSITSAGGTVTQTISVPVGEKIAFTQAGIDLYMFTGWTVGSMTYNQLAYDLDTSENTAITATFSDDSDLVPVVIRLTGQGSQGWVHWSYDNDTVRGSANADSGIWVPNGTEMIFTYEIVGIGNVIFTGWVDVTDGYGVNEPSVTRTVNDEKTIICNFHDNTDNLYVLLTVNIDPMGGDNAVSKSYHDDAIGADMQSSAGAIYVPVSANVQLTGIPDDDNGYQFMYWTGNTATMSSAVTVSPNVIAMNAPKTLTAHFAVSAELITMTVNKTADLGTISASVDGTVIFSLTSAQTAGSFKIAPGTSVTFSAAATSQGQFDHWIVNGTVSFDTPFTETFSDSSVIKAAFFDIDRMYMITLRADPSHGHAAATYVDEFGYTIEHTTDNTDTPGTVEFYVPALTPLSFTAQALDGYSFLYWDTQAFEMFADNPTGFMFGTDVTVDAVFTTLSSAVQLHVFPRVPGYGGTVAWSYDLMESGSVVGIVYGHGGDYYVPNDVEVNFTATPTPLSGARLIYWDVSTEPYHIAASDPYYTLDIAGVTATEVTVTAVFMVNVHKLTVTSSVGGDVEWYYTLPEGGTVTGGTGVYYVPDGARLTFEAFPATADYLFGYWVIDGETANKIYGPVYPSSGTVEILTDFEIDAVFISSSSIFTIDASVDGTGGSITPSGAVGVNAGDDKTFTFSPAPGYHMVSITVDGATTPCTNPSYTFYNVVEGHEISVLFELDPYIQAEAGANGAIDPEGNVSVTSGSDRTFTITADEYYTVDKVTVNGIEYDVSKLTPTSDPRKWTYTFINVIDNSNSISVSFKIDTSVCYAVTVTAGAGGNVNVLRAADDVTIIVTAGTITIIPVPIGTDVTVTADPSTGSAFVYWTITGVSDHPASSVYTKTITGNTSIDALFLSGSSVRHIVVTAGPGGDVSWTYVYVGETVFGGTGAYCVPLDSDMVFVIEPASDHVIDEIILQSIGGVGPTWDGTEWTYRLTVVQNDSLTVTFTSGYYVDATAGVNGTISPSGHIPVKTADNPVVFIITPSVDYVIDSLIVGSIGPVNAEWDGTNWTYTLTVLQNDSISVTFTEGYNIDASTGPNGTIEPLGRVSVRSGDSQTFVITPDTGYIVSSIIVDGTPILMRSDYRYGPETYTIYDNGILLRTIEVTFTDNTRVVFDVDVTVNDDAKGTASVTDPADPPYQGGETVTVTIVPNEGFRIKTVTDNGVVVNASEIIDNGDGTFSYVFEVYEDHFIVVSFEEPSFLGLTQTQWWLLLLVLITTLEVTIVCCYVHLRWKQEEFGEAQANEQQ